MTPLSVISLAPESLAQVESFAQYFQDELESGRIDPLDVYLKCTGMQKAMESVKSLLQKYATDEAEKYGKGEFEKHSFKIKVGEVGSKYHFDKVDDPVLRRREVEFEAKKSLVDERKTFLKSVKSTTTVIDDETGEVITLTPVPKTSTTSVIVTMK